MTPFTTEQIAALRRANYSYRFIGEALNLSPNTVKSICRRQNFTAEGPRKTKAEKQNAQLCRNCCKLLPVEKRSRTFCSEKCRLEWWSKNKRIIEICP